MKFLQKIVRNEAAQADPPEIYNARVLIISTVACGGALLFGMDMGIIGGVLTMDTFKDQYGLSNQPASVTAQLSSNIVSVIQAGAFAGALLSTWLANRVGRRWSLIISSLLVFVGVALQAAASGHLSVLYVGRLVAGIAIGIASTVNPLYVSENAPRGIRGLLTGIYQLSIVTGLTLAFWINYGSLLHISGHAQYIIPLALQAIPAVILFIGMFLANESPRYLAQKSPDKAWTVLAKLRGLPIDHPYIQQEMNGILSQLEEERANFSGTNMFDLFKEAFATRSNRRRSILCITLMMWSNLTGTNAMTYYSPSIFASIGLSSTTSGLLATGVYGIVKMIACAIFILFVSDNLGRRRSFLWTGIGQGIALYYVGFYIRFDPPVSGQPLNAPGYVAIVAIYAFAGIYQFGWGPAVWTYCSEIPAARLRALNMGMATASQWLFNFVVAKCTPLMFATLGPRGYGTYFLYGSFCFLMVVYAWVLVPETKGLSLEEINILFDQESVRSGRTVVTNGFAGSHDRGLGAQILAPTDAEYTARVESYWSSSAKLKPACILQPKSTTEVAAALKVLVSAGQPFAVRSGGHTNWAGSNNIQDGVTLDLGSLDTVTVSSDRATADIGPGARWRDVYAELHKSKLAVAGGREGNVGVAGLLLGGGNTFFTGRHGFACDNVVAYEVVLADGSVITADAETNADLFRALKGGSNNFGVVTKFTMKTIPSDQVWAGMTFYPKQTIPQAIDAVVAFSDRIRDDPDSNLVCIFTHMPEFKDVVVATMFNNIEGVEAPPAYDQWRELPQIMNTIKMTTISEMAFEYNIPANNYAVWFTACFKNDSRIVTKSSELHDKLVAEIKELAPDGDFVTQCVLQPLPKLYSEQSVKAGGNVMGVERHADDGLLLLATAMMKTPEQEAAVYPKVKAWVDEVRTYADTLDGNLKWIYLNYADPSQDVLKSYGVENLKKIKAAAAKYDPDQVFQKLCPGGFKISKVDV
ncbi:hypothetical protein E8E14_014367 [Neopestalotiopsis sp. 37M]|nr:hypothetical protein E8E14_014367 [Neopestalotiopsis sp. 37M]